MSRQNYAAGAKHSWKTSVGEAQKGNVGLELPHRVPTGTLPCGAVRRGPTSSRPQNGRSTDSLCCAPRKAADTQFQSTQAAEGAVSCKAMGVELPKALGTHLLHLHVLDTRQEARGNYFGALRFNNCPTWF